MTTVFLTPNPDTINDSGVDTVIGDLNTPTFSANDSISNVSLLEITDTFGGATDIVPLSVTLANISLFELLTDGNAGNGTGEPWGSVPLFNHISGIGTAFVDSQGSGTDNVNFGPTTAIVVFHNSSQGGVQVTGGSNVTVDTFGGAVVVGDSNSGSLPLAGQTPTGAVSVIQNGFGDVNITGGTSVTVVANLSGYGTQVLGGEADGSSGGGDISIGNTGDNTGNSPTGGSANPTGPVVVADYGANNGSGVTVYGGSSVFVAAAGDFVTVGDGTALNDTTGPVTVDDIAPVTWTNTTGMDNDITILGGSNVTVYTNTSDVDIEGPTGNVAVTDTATSETMTGSGGGDAFVFISGGNNVAVAASGVDVEVDGAAGAVTINNFSTPLYDGILNPYDEETYVNGAAKNVTVATNSGAVYVESVSATGDVNVENFATGFFPAGLTSVSASAGLVSFGAVSGSLSSDAPQSVDVYGGHNVSVFAASGSIVVGSGANTVQGIDSSSSDTAVENPTGQVVIAEIGVNTGYHYENHIAVGGGTNVTIVTTGAGGDGNVFYRAEEFFSNDPPNSTEQQQVVQTSSGAVLPGISVGSLVENGGSPVTGAVTIYDLYSGRHHESISVLGGTTVSINNTYSSGNSGGGTITVGTKVNLNVAGTAATNLADDPTGTVQIDDSSIFGSKVYFGQEMFHVTTNGSAVVTVQGGACGTITDAQSTLTSADTALGTSHLQTVILDGVSGTTTITSDALANLTIANAMCSTVDVVNDTANSALTVTLGNATGITLNDEAGQVGFSGPTPFIGLLAINTVIGSDDITLNTPAVTLLAINAASGSSLALDGGSITSSATLKKVIVTGAGGVVLGNLSGDTVLALIDASGNSGGVGVEINPGETGFKGSSGNDVLVLDQNALGASVSLDGGAGTNTVYNDYLAASGGTDVALGNIGFGKFQNFQNFGVIGAASGSYNAEGFQNLIVGGNNVPGHSGLIGVAGAITFTNVATGASLELIDTAGSPTVTYQLQTPVSKGSLTIQDGLDGHTTGTTNTVDLTNDTITSVTVNSQGKSGVNELTLTGAALTSVTITGDASLTLDGVTGQAVKTVNASASSGVVDVHALVLDAGGVTITGGSGLLVADGYAATAITTPKDVFNVGTGGGMIGIGSGGAGYAAGTGTSTGSETVNLTAGAPIGTTIVAGTNIGGTGEGSFGIVNNWSPGTIASHQTADSIEFVPNPVVIANASNVVKTFGTYNVSDGLISLAPTSPSVSGAQELQDAQAILDAAGNPVGTVALVTVSLVSGTATFVMEKGGTGGAGDTFVELNGVTGITGFGAVTDPNPTDLANIGAGTSVSLNTPDIGAVFANVTDAAHGGSVSANQTSDETGFAIVDLTANATGFTTTYHNLGNFGVVQADTADTGGNVVVTQVGIDPVLTLSAIQSVTLDSFTYGNSAIANDDPTLLLYAYNGSISIGSVVDASNTGTTLLMAGGNDVTVGGVTDTALTTIDASHLFGDLTLTANQNGLTITGTIHGADTITANGNGDTITIGSETGSDTTETSSAVNINAGGNADHISVLATSSSPGVNIGAAGNSDVISVSDTAPGPIFYLTGNGSSFSSSPLTTQLGSNDTINVGDTKSPADVHAWLGANSTVNLNNSSSSVDLHLLGDTAGASGTNLTVINGVDANGDGVRLHFNDFSPGNISANINESWAGGASWNSQVNVATASTLGQALNIAASQALVVDQQFDGSLNTQVGSSSLQLNSHTGLLDWFQFGGNTFLVEAVNNTGVASAHAALASNDIVVELTGLVDANHIDFAAHSLV